MTKQILVRVNKDFYDEIENLAISKGFEDIQDLIRDNLKKEIKDFKISKISFFVKLKNLFNF